MTWRGFYATVADLDAFYEEWASSEEEFPAIGGKDNVVADPLGDEGLDKGVSV